MKKLVLAIILSGLFTGAAFATETRPTAAPCVCAGGAVQDGSIFTPLHPEYEVKAPLEG
jgi:hypothetical protein